MKNRKVNITTFYKGGSCWFLRAKLWLKILKAKIKFVQLVELIYSVGFKIQFLALSWVK